MTLFLGVVTVRFLAAFELTLLSGVITFGFSSACMALFSGAATSGIVNYFRF